MFYHIYLHFFSQVKNQGYHNQQIEIFMVYYIYWDRFATDIDEQQSKEPLALSSVGWHVDPDYLCLSLSLTVNLNSVFTGVQLVKDLH